ncbi:MAG: TlpA family protein disulfide reductase [Flammeovirgaceae bacterium]
MTKQTSSALLSGITTFAAVFLGGYFLVKQFIPIHNYATLKWIPILLCVLGFWMSGRDNRETPINYLPYLFVQLIVLYFFHFLQFPFVFVLVIVSALALVLSRKEVKWNYKGLSLLTIAGIFTFYLFAQPLIIKKSGFGYDEKGQLVNALVLWGTAENQLKELPSSQSYFTQDQQRMSLEQYKGKNLFITFWATWCGPCMREKPHLEKLKTRFKHDPNVAFIDIAIDDHQDRWMNYLNKKQPQGIQLIADNSYETKQDFEFRSIPTHVIVNTEGVYKVCNQFKLARKLLVDNTKVDTYVGAK